MVGCQAAFAGKPRSYSGMWVPAREWSAVRPPSRASLAPTVECGYLQEIGRLSGRLRGQASLLQGVRCTRFAFHHSLGRALARLLLILICPPLREAEWRRSSGGGRVAPCGEAAHIERRSKRSRPEAMPPDECRSEGTPSLGEGLDAGAKTFASFGAFAKGSRRKGETISSRYRRNGYVHLKEIGRLSGRLREQARSHIGDGVRQGEPGRPEGRHVQTETTKGLDMNSLIRDRNHRSAGSLSCTPLQAIDNCAASMGNGGSSARNAHPSTSAHAA